MSRFWGGLQSEGTQDMSRVVQAGGWESQTIGPLSTLPLQAGTTGPGCPSRCQRVDCGSSRTRVPRVGLSHKLGRPSEVVLGWVWG